MIRKIATVLAVAVSLLFAAAMSVLTELEVVAVLAVVIAGTLFAVPALGAPGRRSGRR